MKYLRLDILYEKRFILAHSIEPALRRVPWLHHVLALKGPLFLSSFCFCLVLEIERRALHLVAKCSTTGLPLS